MSADLAVPGSYVEGLARGASREYKTYDIRKRTGGFRTIHHPSKRLKALQRWLLVNVLSALPVHTAAAAYRAGRSIFDNATRHAPSHYLLRMDFEDFFPSIQTADFARYMREHPHLFTDWLPADIEVFAKLVFRDGRLTIGAPTSPAISNILCYDLDAALDAISTASDVVYSRYADDLFFSTAHPNVLAGIETRVVTVLKDLGIPAGLVLNKAKTRHSSKRGRRRVTGITLGSDGRPHVGRHRKREIRALIHQYASLDNKQRAYLAGLISFVIGLDPQFMNHLVTKYGLVKVRTAMRVP